LKSYRHDKLGFPSRVCLLNGCLTLTLWHSKFLRFHTLCDVLGERGGESVVGCLESFVDIYYNFSRLLLNLKSYFYYLLLLLLLMLLVGEFEWCGSMDKRRRE